MHEAVLKVEAHSGYKYCVYMCISIHACIMCLHAAIVLDLNNVEFSACVFFVSSLVNLVTDEWKKEEAKARATAGKHHEHHCS